MGAGLGAGRQTACLTANAYAPHRRHPELFAPEGFAELADLWLRPEVQRLVGLAGEAEDADALKALAGGLLKEECWEVYSFDCLTAEFLQTLNEELEHFYRTAEEHSIPIRRPNSMNNYGVIVNEIGLRPLVTALQQRVIWPLARCLFPVEGAVLDDHHSFMVRYQAGEDLGLDMHTDDADVTFNVCVGHQFSGATLAFCGQVGTPAHRHHTHTYSHQLGRAVMHLGRRRHGADDIVSGQRVNLIVWSHNNGWRSSDQFKGLRENYEREAGPPDKLCVSYTHDRDFEQYRVPTEEEQRRRNRARPWCPPPGKEHVQRVASSGLTPDQVREAVSGKDMSISELVRHLSLPKEQQAALAQILQQHFTLVPMGGEKVVRPKEG